MKRRTFLRRSGLLAAGVGLVLPRGARAGVLAGRIKIGVKYAMVLEGETALEKFEALKQAGMQGTEVMTRAKVDHDAILAASKETGIPVHGVVNSTDPDIRGAIDLAEFYGADSVLALTGDEKGVAYAKQFAAAQKRIGDVVGYAEKKRIRICIENVRATFLKEAEEMARFLDSFESDFVKSYYDTGNTITWTEQSAEHWAKVLGKRVHKIDVKDRGHAEFGDAKQARAGVTTGTDGGEVNWKDVRQALAAINFTGWATAEVKGGDTKRLTRMARWMREVLKLTG